MARTSNLTAPDMVVFDLDNTLYPYEPCHHAGMEALYHFLGEHLNIKRSAAEDCFVAARNMLKSQLGSTAASHHRLLYFHLLLEMVGFQSQPQMALQLEALYWENYLSKMKLFEGARRLLEVIRHRNIPTALVTDLVAHIQFRKLVALDIDSAFDWVVTSEEAGKDKCEQAPFYVLKRKAQLERTAKIWMIGDAPADGVIKSLFPAAHVIAFNPDGKGFKGADVVCKDHNSILAAFESSLLVSTEMETTS